jgi:hypothetical protein
MNDDFSYARSAQALAERGRIIYNGWGSPMLWPQAAYGALVIRLAGFGYGSLQATGVFCAVALVPPLMFALARRCAATRLFAVLATLVLTLNPIYLGVAPSFMTDVPSLALLLLALLVLACSVVAPRPGGGGGETTAHLSPRLFWAAIALGVVAGSNRQISWLAVLGSLLGLFWLLPARRDRGLILTGGALLLACAVPMTLWFNRQPYTIPANPKIGLQILSILPNVAFLFIYKFLNQMGLFLLPLVFSRWRRGGRTGAGVLSVWSVGLLLRAAARVSISDHDQPVGRRLSFDRLRPVFDLIGRRGRRRGRLREAARRAAASASRRRLSSAGQSVWRCGVSAAGIGRNSDPAAARAAPDARTDRTAMVTISAGVVGIVASIPWLAQMNAFDRYLLFPLSSFLVFWPCWRPRQQQSRAARHADVLSRQRP